MIDKNKINFLTDKFLEIADELELEEVNLDNTSLNMNGFYYIPDNNKNYWSFFYNEKMDQLVINMVYDKKPITIIKNYMEYIKKLGYHSYLEAPARFQSIKQNMILTIKDIPFVHIHPRWGGNNDIIYQ